MFKLLHPSNKICRYFLKNECSWDSDCWYRHLSKSYDTNETNSDVMSCNVCEKVFQLKSELMKHKKSDHFIKVSKCRNFVQKNCKKSENECWFRHDELDTETETDNDDKQDSVKQNQDFHEAQEKTPPDQMNKILNLINKLSLQVEMLEKRAMTS